MQYTNATLTVQADRINNVLIMIKIQILGVHFFVSTVLYAVEGAQIGFHSCFLQCVVSKVLGDTYIQTCGHFPSGHKKEPSPVYRKTSQ